MKGTLAAPVEWTTLAGFGRSRFAKSQVVSVGDVKALRGVFSRSLAERTPLTFRGAGRSYGDPALLDAGLVVDMTQLSRVLSWDPETGVIDAEPGLTIEGLWRQVLPDGYWPAVVPGTMRPTLGGCLAMNIHGKNNFRVGSFGEHVLDFDLLSLDGQLRRCSRSEHPALFHAVISGLGLLGAVTRVRLQTKRVESGNLRVRAATASSLEGVFEQFEARLPGADYLVGWIDCAARGGALGRGVTHDANYLSRDADPLGSSSLELSRQVLPSTVLGLPKRYLPWLMRAFANHLGTRLINAAKYYHARLTASDRPFFQSHVGFAFLLDYVPGWERGIAPDGLIQFQVFAHKENALQVFRKVLQRSIKYGMPAYLGVMKRHRPDPFLLTHALDGYSLALDYRLTPSKRGDLQRLLRSLTDFVLDYGGKFYFAKDSVLTAEDVSRAYGPTALLDFEGHKQALDPLGLIESELSRRVFGTRSASR